jgi:acetyl-CoA hydrolase
LIIDNCAHPDFRETLRGYISHLKKGHEPLSLRLAFAMHQKFIREGDMRGVDWEDYLRT